MVKITFSFSGTNTKKNDSENQIISAFAGYTGGFKKTKNDGIVSLEYSPMLLEEALTKINEINENYIDTGLGTETDVKINTVEVSK